MFNFNSIRLIDFVIVVTQFMILFLLLKLDLERKDKELALANLLIHIKHQVELNKQMLGKLSNPKDDD